MRQVLRRAVDVLVVDDDRETTDTLAEILTSHGYRVSIADNGMQAIEFIARNPLPRLIIMGMFMADMGGVEFLSYRKGSSWERVPIVILADTKQPVPIPGWAGQVLPRSFDPYELLSAVRIKIQSTR